MIMAGGPKAHETLLGWVLSRGFRFRGVLLGLVDVAAWAAGLGVVAGLRYGLPSSQRRLGSFLILMALLASVQVAAGRIVGVYRGRYRVGSFDEVSRQQTPLSIEEQPQAPGPYSVRIFTNTHDR